MSPNATLSLTLVVSYLLGSMPFGLWIAKGWKGIDVRTVGSGNIGSTNVWRTCGPAVGSVVFALDVLKGFLPPLLVSHAYASYWAILAAFLAILGHNFSIWLKFKGGKGIATSLGALLGVSPLVGLSAFGLFGVTLLLFRVVSLGSLVGAVSLPVLMPLFYPGDRARLLFGALACVLAVYKHRVNIQRLFKGTEPKVIFPWDRKKNESQA